MNQGHSNPPAPSDQQDAAAPSHEEIAARANELYIASGCAEGRCHENWLQAVAELQNGRDIHPALPALGPATQTAVHVMSNEGGGSTLSPQLHRSEPAAPSQQPGYAPQPKRAGS